VNSANQTPTGGMHGSVSSFETWSRKLSSAAPVSTPAMTTTPSRAKAAASNAGGGGGGGGSIYRVTVALRRVLQTNELLEKCIKCSLRGVIDQLA
jgi:hypothetical protein